MHLQRAELPVTLDAGPTIIRSAQWGDLLASVARLAAGTDLTPLLQGATR